MRKKSRRLKPVQVEIKRERERERSYDRQHRNTKRNANQNDNEVSPYTRIKGDYCNQIYANKVDNLKEMDKFLENYNFPKLNQE